MWQITGVLGMLGTMLIVPVLWPSYSFPQTMVAEANPQLIIIADDATLPKLSAASYVVIDAASGVEVLSNDDRTVRPIASLTKLVTAAAVRSHHAPAEPITITAADVAAHGRAGKLEAGETYTAHTLLMPLLLESSNDAAAAFERVYPTLVDDMNKLVKQWGATDTHFTDASGLDNGNVSSVRDLLTIMQYVHEEFPGIVDITRLSQFVGEETTWRNVNPASGLSSYSGGKHGYTDAAGGTAALWLNATVGNEERTFAVVILGSENIAADIKEINEFLDTSIALE